MPTDMEERVRRLESDVARLTLIDKGIDLTSMGWDGSKHIIGTLTIQLMGYQNPLQIVSPAVWLWIDASNRLRIHNAVPTADGDGTVVGTQT